jgi:hypothetical protein
MRASNGKLDMVWWIPTEFWEASFKRSGTVPQRQREEMIATIDNYIIVAAIEGSVDSLGAMTSTSKEDMEKRVLLLVGKERLTTIPESELTPGARNFIQIMKPIITNMLGQMGQGLHMVAFKSKDENGKPFVDPKLPGQISIKVGDKSFDFRLPLATLLPARVDAESGERFPGSYNFNPFTGKKLVGAQ